MQVTYSVATHMCVKRPRHAPLQAEASVSWANLCSHGSMVDQSRSLAVGSQKWTTVGGCVLDRVLLKRGRLVPGSLCARGHENSQSEMTDDEPVERGRVILQIHSTMDTRRRVLPCNQTTLDQISSPCGCRVESHSIDPFSPWGWEKSHQDIWRRAVTLDTAGDVDKTMYM